MHLLKMKICKLIVHKLKITVYEKVKRLWTCIYL